MSSITSNTSNTSNSTKHKKEKPKSSPAILHKVTVPGPINAAATNGPGPILLIHFFTNNYLIAI